MKIGLYFGTFNPIHIGHLAIANIMVEDSDLDKVWFVVSPHNPFKDKREIIHEFDRLEMIRLSIYENPLLEVNDIEFSLTKPSYTTDTLAHLREKYPQHEFSLIIGEDNYAHFHKWKNYESILEHHRLLVYPRNNSKPSQVEAQGNIQKIDAPLLDISATYLRKSLIAHKSIRYLIPDEALKYIESKGLYR